MAETPTHNIRVADPLWEAVMAKVERIGRPEVSASSVCVEALERFAGESDAASLKRLGSKAGR